MKKKQQPSLGRFRPKQVAEQLKKGMGKDKALRMAHALASNLEDTTIEDVNSQIFTPKELTKNASFWAEVKSLVAKMK